MNQENAPDRTSKAQKLYSGPYNCSQSVAAAFSDILGKDDDEIFRLMSGFGFGMGGEQSVCGAVSGGIFVISSSIKNPIERDEIYLKVYALINRFKTQNNDKLNCIDLVGENATDTEFHTICPVLIEKVVRLVDDILSAARPTV